MNIVRSCQNVSATRKYDTIQNVPCSFRQNSSIKNVFHFFSRQKCRAQLFSQRSSALLLWRNVVRDSDNLFRFFILTWGETFVA